MPSASAADLDFDQLDAFRRQWRRTSLAPRDETLNRFLGLLGVQEPQQVPTMARTSAFRQQSPVPHSPSTDHVCELQSPAWSGGKRGWAPLRPPRRDCRHRATTDRTRLGDRAERDGHALRRNRAGAGGPNRVSVVRGTRSTGQCRRPPRLLADGTRHRDSHVWTDTWRCRVPAVFRHTSRSTTCSTSTSAAIPTS